MSSSQNQSKIICSEFILSSLITASPHGFIWERHWWRERLLKRPTSLFSEHCLRNAFLLAPSAPCVDALSAGCVLHVKQAADAVRKKGPRGTRGPRTQGGPTAMPPA